MAKDYYHYDPSIAAAGIFTALFALSTIFHLFQLIRTRTWYFIPFAIGGIFELVGFGTRVINANQTPNWNLGIYIISTLAILLAPALFAASIYMSFGRIILLADGERHAIIKKKWLTKVFVAGDILSFAAQCLGGGMLSKQNASSAKTGKLVIELGLAIQILFFGFFLINIYIFWKRIIRAPTTQSKEMPWKKHSTVLLVSGAVILIRCLYRVIEYIQGETGVLQTKEVFIYLLDAALMLIVMIIFHIFHPSEVNSLLRGGKVAKLFRTETVDKPYGSVPMEDVQSNSGVIYSR